MRYRLRTLLIAAAVGPLAIALAYWAVILVLGGPLKPQLYFAFLAFSVYAFIDLWRGAARSL